MTYYKIISQNQVIGVGHMFLRWNSKRNRFYYSDINDAHCVQDDLTSTPYHAEWLKTLPEGTQAVEEVVAHVINAQEYEDLYETLKGDEVVPFIPDPLPTAAEPTEKIVAAEPRSEQPLTVQQMREKIAEQDAAIGMLTECLLEVSQLLYEE